jgi:hypothetical protein
MLLAGISNCGMIPAVIRSNGVFAFAVLDRRTDSTVT